MVMFSLIQMYQQLNGLQTMVYSVGSNVVWACWISLQKQQRFNSTNKLLQFDIDTEKVIDVFRTIRARTRI